MAVGVRGCDKAVACDRTGEYKLQFHFTDDDDVPYANTKYIAYFADGTQKEGITDEGGLTASFLSDSEDEIEVELLLGFQME
jgi:type VI secretion system secreted protein VgrG